MKFKETKPALMFAGVGLFAALALSVAGCGGGSSLTSALGIGDSSVTVNGIAYYVVTTPPSTSLIEGAAVAFTPAVGSAITGSTTGTDGTFTLSGVPAGAVGTFTFTNNTNIFTSGDITIPSNGGSIGSVDCTEVQSTLVKK